MVLSKGTLTHVPIISEQQIARYQEYTGFSHIPHVDTFCMENCTEDGKNGFVDGMDSCVDWDEVGELQHIDDQLRELDELLYQKWLCLHWPFIG